MYTVLIKYQVRLDAPHPLLDDDIIKRTKVLKVQNLEDLNAYTLIDVKILDYAEPKTTEVSSQADTSDISPDKKIDSTD